MSLIIPAYTDDEKLVQLESGILVPYNAAMEMARQQRKPECVDVLCGCGGFGLGMIQAGYGIAAAIEYDTTCIITYMCNLCRWGEVKMHFIEPQDEDRMEKALQKEFKRREKEGVYQDSVAGCGWISGEPRSTGTCANMIVGDVRKLTGERLLKIIGMERGELDCMTGGPPCQGFSYAGKRDVYDARNSLVFEYARLIVETNPKTCIMENVPGILNMVTPEGIGVVDKFVAILKDGGFHGVNAFEEALKQPGAQGFMKRGKSKKDLEKEESAKQDDKQEELFQ